MKISAIVPVYNGATYLEESLGSALAQTRPVDEIIVIDDGSTDDSLNILRRYRDRISLSTQQNIGVAPTRNLGLERASGDVLAFLDQDDIWPVNRTAVLVEALENNPEAQVASGAVEVLYQRSMPPGEHDHIGTIHREFLLGSLLIRREVFARIGAFAIDVGYGDDTDFWLRRVETNVPTIRVADITLQYRLHDNNTSIDRGVSVQHLLTVLQRSLQRRRRDGR